MTVDRPRTAPFVLRELRWEDFPARRDGFLALFNEVKENPDLGLTLPHTPPTEADEVAWFSGLYQRVLRKDAIVVVGEMDARAVGMVSIASTRWPGQASESSHVGVLGIVVDRRYRGRGLGEALMVRALELARERFEWVRLQVFSVNVGAKRLYERLGFRTVGRLEGEVLRDGRYLDEEQMSLHMRDWHPPTVPRAE